MLDHAVDGLGVDLVIDVVGDAGGVEHVRDACEVAELDHDGVRDDEGARAHVREALRRACERSLSVDDVVRGDKR